MPTTKKKDADDQGEQQRKFTEGEIKQTFERLGLNDDAMRQRLLDLSKTAEPEKSTPWFVTDSASRNFSQAANAELE
jgi:hypothetical protein